MEYYKEMKMSELQLYVTTLTNLENLTVESFKLGDGIT